MVLCLFIMDTYYTTVQRNHHLYESESSIRTKKKRNINFFLLKAPWRYIYNNVFQSEKKGKENPFSRMSLQQHVKAATVTLDYPSVSDFERDFLGLSSRSQWSSMLHRTRYHRSKFESRYQAYQPLLSPPYPILFCPHRFVAPATRGLRRCDWPFPESSSIIELDTEPHREASAAF